MDLPNQLRHYLSPLAGAPAIGNFLNACASSYGARTGEYPWLPRRLGRASVRLARQGRSRQPPPRINHYEVVAAWTDAKAFDAHETAAHTLQFRAATVMGGKAGRANLYDQRLYKAL